MTKIIVIRGVVCKYEELVFLKYRKKMYELKKENIIKFTIYDKIKKKYNLQFEFLELGFIGYSEEDDIEICAFLKSIEKHDYKSVYINDTECIMSTDPNILKMVKKLLAILNYFMDKDINKLIISHIYNKYKRKYTLSAVRSHIECYPYHWNKIIESIEKVYESELLDELSEKKLPKNKKIAEILAKKQFDRLTKKFIDFYDEKD